MCIYIYTYIYHLHSMGTEHLQRNLQLQTIQKTMTYFDLRIDDNRHDHLPLITLRLTILTHNDKFYRQIFIVFFN
jgi:hypothetical protein